VKHEDISNSWNTGSNLSDCGIYAIAFAMAIMQPEELPLDEKQMRPHLKAYRLDGQINACSLQKESHQEPNQKGEVFCTCRQPEFGNMISCYECGEWFHQSCINLTQYLLTPTGGVSNCHKPTIDTDSSVDPVPDTCIN
jgi:hypothetical protein